MKVEPGVLEGVCVLDFSRVLAGPFCTMILGDLGADVIKVESPLGDETRQWGPPWLETGTERQSAYYLSVNRNKRSCVLDLKTAEGREAAKRMATRSQVVVENFRPGTMERFGLGYETLRRQNPSLVYCSISSFGQSGPYRDLPGYDYLIQAVSGLMSITGPQAGPCYKVGVAISDVLAGLFAAFSILAALRQAEATGRGQLVDVSLLESQVAALVNVAANFLVSGESPGRYGNQHPNIVPYQTFRASDGEFVVAVGNDRQFQRLCDCLDRVDLKEELRFLTNPDRVRNRDLLSSLLGRIFQTATVSHWMELLRKNDVPAAPINDIPSALSDRQLKARDLIREVTVSDNRSVRVVGFPVHLSRDPATIRRPAPGLGEHTQEILELVRDY